jgi:hypothetical protein
MKNFLHVSLKLMGLKIKKNFFRRNLGENKNIFFLNDINKSNKPIFLFGPNFKIVDIKSAISSKILISFSKESLLQFWESCSGRLIRNVGIIRVFPKCTFINCKYNIIGIISKKNLLIFELSNGANLYSLLIQPIFPIKFQLIKNLPLVIINDKSDKIQIIDYQKGYFLKKFDSNRQNVFLNGINYDKMEYFFKNKNSVIILGLSKPKFCKLNFTENHFLDVKKFEIQEILFNIVFIRIFNSNMLMIFNQNYYLWDCIVRLIILN